MKTMTNSELVALGKDLRLAKILVLRKHGFTCSEIAYAMGISESSVRRLIHSAETDSEQSANKD